MSPDWLYSRYASVYSPANKHFPNKSPIEAQITLYIIIPLTRTYYYTITTFLYLSTYIYMSLRTSLVLSLHIYTYSISSMCTTLQDSISLSHSPTDLSDPSENPHRRSDLIISQLCPWASLCTHSSSVHQPLSSLHAMCTYLIPIHIHLCHI